MDSTKEVLEVAVTIIEPSVDIMEASLAQPMMDGKEHILCKHPTIAVKNQHGEVSDRTISPDQATVSLCLNLGGTR